MGSGLDTLEYKLEEEELHIGQEVSEVNISVPSQCNSYDYYFSLTHVLYVENLFYLHFNDVSDLKERTTNR